jgi:1-phosphatidylinositol-4-phosphate 5-kinase
VTELKSMSKEKRKQYKGAIFWYYFRVSYPLFMPILVLIFMIVAITRWNTVQGYLVMGSILSLISTVLVISSYLMIVPWRKHPSALILYRALSSTVFSVNIILNALSVNNGQALSCRNYSVVTQMMLLAGEGWLTTIAADLVASLTNPFTSYKQNLQRYQFMVWGISAFIASTLFFNSSCQGEVDNGICWLNISPQTISCLWGYYLFWIICMYIYQIWAAVFAYYRLKKGLPATFEIRKQCAIETFQCLFSYAIYMSVLMLFLFIIASNPSSQPGTSMNNFALFVLFVIANKGTVDGAVWFSLHDFTREDEASGAGAGAGRYEAVRAERDIEMTGEPRTKERVRLGSNIHLPQDIKQIEDKMKKTITKLADMAIEELDEADLSPQVNLALRQQIVQYVTNGIKTAIDISNKRTVGARVDTAGVFESLGTITKRDKAVVDGIKFDEFALEGEFPFRSYAPDIFKSLRQGEGITDEYYLKVLSQPANERLSEGASGAFMFFCGGGEFIVKTIRDREARVLHASLKEYVQHLRANKESFLCRFIGSYSLEVYSQTFYFVVMANCFDPKAKINERYDIKGSWVGRSADPSKNKKRSTCRHCNTYFVPAKKEKCSVIVGCHEANIVLKDNDLRTKIHMVASESAAVVDMIKKDSVLLGRLGVMDYSLLIGVKKRKFPVVVDESETVVPGANRQSTFRASSVTGPALYYLGIVDFLQDWTFAKQVERMFKIYFTRKDPDGLSVMEPIAYMERFQGIPFCNYCNFGVQYSGCVVFSIQAKWTSCLLKTKNYDRHPRLRR